MTLDRLGSTINASTGQTLLNGATLDYYPAFESSDPRPSEHRGAYFPGSAYIQLPPAPNTSGSPLMFSDSVSFSAWIRPQAVGFQVLFRKTSDPFTTLMISLSATNSLQIDSYAYPQNVQQQLSITGAPAVPLDQWTFAACSLSYESGLSKTRTRIYYDGAEVYMSLDTFRLMDLYSTALQGIGANNGNTDFYTGFIWRMTIYPDVRTFAADIVSSGCPAGLSYCLSLAPITQTYTGDNCLPSCVDGCVRTSDCNLCQDVLCENCSPSETCSQCISNAEVVGATCACSQGYFNNAVLNACDPCQSTCKACTLQASLCTACFSNAILDSAGTCACANAYYPNPTSAQCAAYNQECRTCLSAAVCTSCWSNAEIKESTCVCLNGYFGIANSCGRCPRGCAICAETSCKSCISGYILLENSCSSCSSGCLKCSEAGCDECFSGYFLTSNTCVSCPFSCKTCSAASCYSCLPGYFHVGNSCTTHCMDGYKEDLENWLCYPYKGVEVTAVATGSNNITINFSRPIHPTLTLSDLDLSLSDTDFHHYNVSAQLSEIRTNQIYQLALEIRTSYLPSKNEFSISFLHPKSSLMNLAIICSFLRFQCS